MNGFMAQINQRVVGVISKFDQATGELSLRCHVFDDLNADILQSILGQKTLHQTFKLLIDCVNPLFGSLRR